MELNHQTKALQAFPWTFGFRAVYAPSATNIYRLERAR